MPSVGPGGFPVVWRARVTNLAAVGRDFQLGLQYSPVRVRAAYGLGFDQSMLGQVYGPIPGPQINHSRPQHALMRPPRRVPRALVISTRGWQRLKARVSRGTAL